MRAYQLPKGGAGIDALVEVDRPMPKPLHRQVLVKVIACSLNFRDLGIVRGTYRSRCGKTSSRFPTAPAKWSRSAPASPASRPATRSPAASSSAGPAASRDRMLHASALGGSIDGMLAEYVVLEEEGAVKIPGHLSIEEGATLPCAAVTAWDAMLNHAKLVAGQTVLLQGTGGVSIFGLQFAHAMGITAIITSSSEEKLERAKALGAACGINYKTTPEWDKAAIAFNSGRGVDHVLEVGGANTLTLSFNAIRVGGKVSIIGGLSGGARELNPGLIFSKRANVQGISVGSTQTFETMNAAIAANKIKPVVDRVFGFDETRAAYEHMAAGAHFGKIVIRVA